MHLTVLSRSSEIYTTRRLVEAAGARGVRARVVDPLEVEMGLFDEAPQAYWRGKRFPRTDVVVPRIGLSIHQYGLSVVNQLELLGIPALNGAYGIAASRNKMRSLQMLSAAGVPVPRTVMASDPSGLKDMARLVGGVPVLVKLLSTSEKSGVMICETLQSLEAALEAILGLGQNIVVQQYLKGAKGRDLRALVVGGEVVAAMRRRPPVGRFSRNLRRGAQFEQVSLPPAYARAAAQAARVLQLEVCAVDMLDVKGTPRVFEVNSSPSIREAESACGVDAAGRIVERAMALVRRGRAPAGAGRRRRDGAAAAARP
ncbi:RimK family alpha-L-glutamate ligase [Anaeromyxobacter sp. PSR-1]|uniref:ATP-grasp domain-containing protein n=1 Tax=unclassified Anaeromyxobacter TaxID=2620896 RepID=UPI0005DCBA3A|nr:RimK family alpha-L-glutamate ligase [Anaeromyxobacter sp. PSR-1]GAO03448.1 putative alpha-L-glutamate ligase [Anaeromyxobacter sp. PSR-1]